MSDTKKETKEEVKIPMRQIIIETDGININIVKAEVTNLEMVGLIARLKNKFGE